MDEKIQKLVAAANSTNEVAKSIGLKQLAEMGLDKDGNPIKKEEPKAKKAPAPKKEKVEKPNAEKKKETQYDCDDLLEKEKERKKKAKAAAEKRANEPKKSEATKNREAIEKTAIRVEKNVEKRIKKDDISFGEIKKLIAEYEKAIAELKSLLAQHEGKMAKGGSLSSEETSKILERARGIHKHHCNCGGKMKDGGAVSSYSKWESDVTDNVAEMLDISVGDAQGIVESNSFKMAQSWSKGLSAKETAQTISKS